MPLDLDPRFTFDAFVVGPANRLAVAAARRVADTPGTTYNPLFIYSGSGPRQDPPARRHRAHEVQRLHGIRRASSRPSSSSWSDLAGVEAGERDAFRSRLRAGGVLLLDDVQFLAGQRQVQEELIRAWDALIARGGQVVLTSDRPPQEIDGLDDRLLSRLSGGLIVDMSPPDYETRIAIARRKADERGQHPVARGLPGLARIAFTNVRELQGALNRLIAVQELEGRAVTADEVPRLLGAAAERGRTSSASSCPTSPAPWARWWIRADRQIADAILAWEGEGFRTRRLDSALSGHVTAAPGGDLVRTLRGRHRPAPGDRGGDPRSWTRTPGAGRRVLRDPDRVAEAEALLAGCASGRRRRPARRRAAASTTSRGGLPGGPGRPGRGRGARCATYNPSTCWGRPARADHAARRPG
jgi:hypothetical protein